MSQLELPCTQLQNYSLNQRSVVGCNHDGNDVVIQLSAKQTDTDVPELNVDTIWQRGNYNSSILIWNGYGDDKSQQFTIEQRKNINVAPVGQKIKTIYVAADQGTEYGITGLGFKYTSVEGGAFPDSITTEQIFQQTYSGIQWDMKKFIYNGAYIKRRDKVNEIQYKPDPKQPRLVAVWGMSLDVDNTRPIYGIKYYFRYPFEGNSTRRILYAIKVLYKAEASCKTLVEFDENTLYIDQEENIKNFKNTSTQCTHPLGGMQLMGASLISSNYRQQICILPHYSYPFELGEFEAYNTEQYGVQVKTFPLVQMIANNWGKPGLCRTIVPLTQWIMVENFKDKKKYGNSPYFEYETFIFRVAKMREIQKAVLSLISGKQAQLTVIKDNTQPVPIQYLFAGTSDEAVRQYCQINASDDINGNCSCMIFGLPNLNNVIPACYSGDCVANGYVPAALAIQKCPEANLTLNICQQVAQFTAGGQLFAKDIVMTCNNDYKKDGVDIQNYYGKDNQPIPIPGTQPYMIYIIIGVIILGIIIGLIVAKKKQQQNPQTVELQQTPIQNKFISQFQ